MKQRKGPEFDAPLDVATDDDDEIVTRRQLASESAPTAPLGFPQTPRFLMTREIGRGGFGVVFEAHDLRLDRKVALKTLSHVTAHTLSRFKTEFRALSEVSHPNLVALYELFDKPQWFFTMELVTGRPLLAALRARARASGHSNTDPAGGASARATRRGQLLSREGIETLRALLVQLVGAIAELHRCGHLHRDVKPSNVVVHQDGTLKLLDFGLVTRYADGALAVAGTPAYMAPEASERGPLSPAADWYSVGVIIYELLTGSRPFSGPMEQMLGQKKLGLAHKPAALIGAPGDLADLCLRLLAPNPVERPSAASILRSLSGLAASPSAGQQESTSAASVNLSQPFVGRDVELAALQRGLAELLAGRAHNVLVHGVSGMGKSALIRHFLAHAARTTGALVLTGRCFEQEWLPYQGLDDVLDDYCRYVGGLSEDVIADLVPASTVVLAILFPILEDLASFVSTPSPKPSSEGLDPLRHRLHAARALADIFEGLARRRPTILFIDDMQWADRFGLELLTELLVHHRPPVLFLGAWREEGFEASALVGDIGVLGDAFTDIHLTGLAADDVRSLIAELAPGFEAPVEVLREAGGNPYLLQEVAQSRVRAAGLVDLEAAIAERARMMSRDALRLLETVAMAGRPVPSAVVFDAAALQGDPMRARAEIIGARFARRQGSAHLTTYHDKVRQAVIAALSIAERRCLATRIATAWEGHGSADAETLFALWSQTEDTASAAHWAEAAARAAESALAIGRAAELVRQAIDLRGGAQNPKLTVWLERLEGLCGA